MDMSMSSSLGPQGLCLFDYNQNSHLENSSEDVLSIYLESNQ